MIYRVGQELVCIVDEAWLNGYTFEVTEDPNPIKGEIYHYAGTHRSIVDGDDYIFLEEFGGESGPAFEKCAFRPVVKTDISLFEDIARKVTEGEGVPA